MNKPYEVLFEANLSIGNELGFLEGLPHPNSCAMLPRSSKFSDINSNTIKMLTSLFWLSSNAVLSNAHFNICVVIEALTYTIKGKL